MEWDKNRKKKAERLNSVAKYLNGKIINTSDIVEVLNRVIKPGDKLILEGDNQKQASFLALVILLFLHYLLDDNNIHHQNNSILLGIY